MSTINDYKKYQEATNKEIFALDMGTNLRGYSHEKMEEGRIALKEEKSKKPKMEEGRIALKEEKSKKPKADKTV